MLEQLLGALGDDVDIERIVQLVNILWDDREKIVQTANMIWENRERLASVIEYVSENRDRLDAVANFIQEHRDDLANLIDRLPEILAGAGEGIHAAGEGALFAGRLLTGEDGAGANVFELAAKAALALERTRVELEHIAHMLQNLGHQIESIYIPSVEPKYIEVLGMRVVAGLDIHESSLADDVAERFTQAADRLSAISDQFEDTAIRLRELGQSLVNTGAKMRVIGAQLQRGGETLRVWADGGVTRGRVAGAKALPEPDLKSLRKLEKEIEKEHRSLAREVERIRKQRQKSAGKPSRSRTSRTRSARTRSKAKKRK